MNDCDHGLMRCIDCEEEADVEAAALVSALRGLDGLLARLAAAEAALAAVEEWWVEIYPVDIFVGGVGSDRGTARVVQIREKIAAWRAQRGTP